jgi:hypothetical protein
MSFITIAGSGVINAHIAGRDAVMIAGDRQLCTLRDGRLQRHQTVEDLKEKKLSETIMSSRPIS